MFVHSLKCEVVFELNSLRKSTEQTAQVISHTAPNIYITDKRVEISLKILILYEYVVGDLINTQSHEYKKY